ncbi:toxin-antitoxin system, toxin component, RelE family [gut metagenome]|uniref:Toxin-antitoxin system, toxin component, RelE family n=1 Tax=gut metagenome TaxID=749906 RepID=J9CLG4_9ZZZZ
MNYHIHITQTAERDMISAADYIEFALKNPEAADHLLDTAEEKINALSQFPQKFPLVDDRILSSWGIRFTIVSNYLAFYRISETEKQVTVVRFLYAKSNWASILKTGFPLQ